MSEEYTEEQLRVIAAQLRQPNGDFGIQIGELMNSGNARMNRHTIAVLNPSPNDTILEIGMGNGYFVPSIIAVDKSIHYTGCDYSVIMVQEAKRLVKSSRAKFVCGDLHTLPFEDSSFNKVFTINTFYFWDDHSRALDEIKRVLTPQGKLILSVRPKHNMGSFPVTQYGFSKFENDEIKTLLKESGFSEIKLTHIHEPDGEVFGDSKKRECAIFEAFKE